MVIADLCPPERNIILIISKLAFGQAHHYEK
jgi:hypothetical protein